MKIVLNTKSHIPCSEIYIEADPELDQPYLIFSKVSNSFEPFTCFKFWHNNKVESLVPSIMPNFCINDRYLEFTSSIPFYGYCKKLFSSEFNFPSSYNVLTHNCAHGAAFALESAEIQLNLPTFFFLNKAGDRCWQRFPLFSVFPLDLYHHVKSVKIAMQEKTGTNLELKKTSECLLKLASNHHISFFKNNVPQLVSETQKAQEKYPHHAERHLQGLRATIDFLNGKFNKEKIPLYEGLINSQEYREKPWSGDHFAFCSNLMGVLLLLKLLIYIQDIKSFTGSDIGDCALAFTTLILLFSIDIHNLNKSDRKSTALSKSMTSIFQHACNIASEYKPSLEEPSPLTKANSI